jgi:protein disulfide-isomerase
MDRRQFLGQAAALVGAAAWTTPAWAATTPSYIDWQTDLRDAHGLAREQDRPILIVFSAKWCTFCHKLLREVGADKRLAAYITANFIPTMLDFDQETRIAKVLEVESLPTTVVLSPQVDLLLQKPGYMKLDVFRKTLETAMTRQNEIRQVNATGGR